MKRIGVIPDTHVPYHDELAWKVCLKALAGWQPDEIVFLGDFADFYSVSSHSKDPNRKSNLEWEIEQVNIELDKVEKLGKKVTFVEGNHENRLERYIQSDAKALRGLVSVPSEFRLRERGWQHFTYKQYYKHPKAKIVFTHDLGSAAEKAHIEAARQFKTNTIIGHTHKAHIGYLGEVEGEGYFGMQAGWLGDNAKADYLHQGKVETSWRKGFATVTYDSDGYVFGQFHPIVAGRTVVDGRLYKCKQ